MAEGELGGERNGAYRWADRDQDTAAAREKAVIGFGEVGYLARALKFLENVSGACAALVTSKLKSGRQLS
jgi:hypothetical protein